MTEVLVWDVVGVGLDVEVVRISVLSEVVKVDVSLRSSVEEIKDKVPGISDASESIKEVEGRPD